MLRTKDESNVSKIEDGLNMMGDALTNIQQLVSECKTAAPEMESLVGTIKQGFVHPTTFVYHMGKDLLVNGADIFHEISTAVGDWESQSYKASGVQVGIALKQLLIGVNAEAPQGLTMSLGSDGYNCPSSGNPVHAGCEVEVNFQAGCDVAQAEIHARINGQMTGAWTDPHNAGNYTMLAETTELMQLQRTTGNQKYTDKINFLFKANGDSCNLKACSRSQVFSIGDAGTNFCNIHDLYCDDDKCHPINRIPFTEKAGKCTEAKASACTP